MPTRTVFATFSPDRLGDYQPAVFLLAGSYALAALIIFLARKPLYPGLKTTAD